MSYENKLSTVCVCGIFILFILLIQTGFAETTSISTSDGKLTDSETKGNTTVSWYKISEAPFETCWNAIVIGNYTLTPASVIIKGTSYDPSLSKITVQKYTKQTRLVMIPKSCLKDVTTYAYYFPKNKSLGCELGGIYQDKGRLLGQCEAVNTTKQTVTDESCGTALSTITDIVLTTITKDAAWKTIEAGRTISAEYVYPEQTINTVSKYKVCVNTPVKGKPYGQTGQLLLSLNGVEFHPFFNTTWNYRITANFTSPSAFTDGVIILRMNSTDINRAKTSGYDIRVTDSANNLLNFYRETWNSTNIILRVLDTSVDSGVNQYYVYYNASGVTDASDPAFMQYGKQSANKTVMYMPFGDKDSIPTPRVEGSSAVAGDTIYVIGSEALNGHKISAYNTTSKTWTGVIPATDFGYRNRACMANFNGSLWIYGGYLTTAQNTYDTTYYNCSYAGVCNQVTALTARPGTRVDPMCEVIENTMYVMGGYNGSGGGYITDVWSTTNGLNWTLLNATGLPPGIKMKSTVLNNTLYAATGYYSPAISGMWSSTNGITWTTVTNATYAQRWGSAFTNNGSALFIIGGTIDNTNGMANVLVSTNLVNFSTAVSTTAWPAVRDALGQYVPASGKMYKLMGWTQPTYQNNKDYVADVWSSTDGVTWTQENAINDFTRNNVNAIWTMASVNQNTTGYIGGAFWESYNNDYSQYVTRIETPSTTDLNNANLTISFWIKDNAAIANGYEEIYEKSNSGSWADGYVVWGGTGGASVDSIAFFSKSYGVSVYATGTLNNAWHFVTITDDGTTPAQKIYVDGTLRNTTTQVQSARSTNPLNIGYAWHGGGRMVGAIDEIQQYKIVLNATQADWLYQSFNTSLYAYSSEEAAIPNVDILNSSPSAGTSFNTTQFTVNVTVNTPASCTVKQNGTTITNISAINTTDWTATFNTTLGTINTTWYCNDSSTNDAQEYDFTGIAPNITSLAPANGTKYYTAAFATNATTDVPTTCYSAVNGGVPVLTTGTINHTVNHTTIVGVMNVTWQCTNSVGTATDSILYEGDLPMILTITPANNTNITTPNFLLNATTNKLANCTITQGLLTYNSTNTTNHAVILPGYAGAFNVSYSCVSISGVETVTGTLFYNQVASVTGNVSYACLNNITQLKTTITTGGNNTESINCYYGCDNSTGACVQPTAQTNYTLLIIAVIIILLAVLIIIMNQLENESLKAGFTIIIIFLSWAIMPIISVGYETMTNMSGFVTTLIGFANSYYWLVWMIITIILLFTFIIEPLQSIINQKVK
jgi:hypothetical protein